MTALRALGRFVRAPITPVPRGARCELCANPIEEVHRHVVELERRAILCACRPCAILFVHAEAGNRHYRTVPERVLVDPHFALADERWSALQVPVRLAFVFFNSILGNWVAVYPSPAGATEAELEPERWRDLAGTSRLVQAIAPDVEALLVHGRRGQPLECLVAPIDACYELVANVRRHWKGFSGGDEAWAQVEALFARLRGRARPLGPEEEVRG